MIKKMVSCKYAGLAKKNYAHRQYLMDTFRIDPLLCKCGHEMQFVEAFFPGGLAEQINETWKFYDWRSVCDPYGMY